MRTETLIIVLMLLAVAVLATGVIGVWAVTRSMRSQKLRKKFGREYDYTIEHTGDRRTAEEILKDREKRVVDLDTRSLDRHERDRYHQEWLEIQAGFVDDPSHSISEANRLITEVMIARGFPVSDFEQRAADLSVLYPEFVPNYRNANEIAMRNQRNEASTEDLRQAIVYYRSLFEELLGVRENGREVQEKEKELVTP